MTVPSRIVLVGFMASGKTTVGRLLAARLGYAFIDLDLQVENREGRSIPELFRAGGEAAFREAETQVTRELDALSDVVIATGGGWMARRELSDRWPGALRIWLRVAPGTALARIGAGQALRPMIDPQNPEGSLRRLLAEREPEYRRAELHVETDDRLPGEIADEILTALLHAGQS